MNVNGRTVGITVIAVIAFWLVCAVVVLIGSVVGVLDASGQAVQGFAISALAGYNIYAIIERRPREKKGGGRGGESTV